MGSKTDTKADPKLAPVTDKPKTGWDISPQALTTTVKGHKIAVHFDRRGEEFFFGFRGPERTISTSGFYSELVSDRTNVTCEYLSPGVWADFRAEELYTDYQQLLSEDAHMEDQRLVAVDAEIDQAKQPSTPAAPPAQVPAQMLASAVSACLGEFSMCESLDEPLSVTVYVSPKKAIGVWVTKLLKAYKSGEVTEAIDYFL